MHDGPEPYSTSFYSSPLRQAASESTEHSLVKRENNPNKDSLMDSNSSDLLFSRHPFLLVSSLSVAECVIDLTIQGSRAIVALRLNGTETWTSPRKVTGKYEKA